MNAKKTLPTEEDIEKWIQKDRNDALKLLCDRLGIYRHDSHETRDTVGWGMNARIEVVCLPVAVT